MSDEKTNQPRSGLWAGHYVQGEKNYPFEMGILFDSLGKITGGGNDGIGTFSIDGTWTQHGSSIEFVKQYIGKHSISYKATYNATGDFISGLYLESGYFEMKFVGPEGSQSVKSGLWRGHYAQDSKNYPFEMELMFSLEDKVLGCGKDGIGEFFIDGTWKQQENSIKFIKQYLGKHSISYQATYNSTGDFINGLYSGSGNFEMKFVEPLESQSVEKYVKKIQQPKAGLWGGHYVHDGKNYPFEMELMFSLEEKVTGGGKDGIGEFSIDGTWKQHDSSMEFVKQYIGKHSISYEATYNATEDFISGKYMGLGDFEMKFVGPTGSQSVKSGLWRGHYVQDGKNYPFEMKLAFSLEGKVTGGGQDGIGEFSIDGTWEQKGSSMEFIKQYIRQHSISYEATYNATGDFISGLYLKSGYFEMKLIRS